MPTVMKLYGIRFYFYSREESRMHVHVEKSGMHAKIWLDDFEVAANKGFKIQELLLIQKMVMKYEKFLKKAWISHFN
jgi:Domain of unknown function (DUF4160)